MKPLIKAKWLNLKQKFKNNSKTEKGKEPIVDNNSRVPDKSQSHLGQNALVQIEFMDWP